MQNKNNVVLFSIVFGVLGVFLGWLIWGSSVGVRMMGRNMYRSSMMTNSHSMNMQDMMNGMVSGLSGKTGDAFDAAFIKEMIAHHEGAVAMAEQALTDAKHVEIKTMATAIISAQTSEISQMKGWLKDWYGENY